MNYYISLTEARDTLGIGTSTLRLWVRQLGIKRHKLPHNRKQTFIHVDELQRLAARKHGTRGLVSVDRASMPAPNAEISRAWRGCYHSQSNNRNNNVFPA